jgi:hypothetical protein
MNPNFLMNRWILMFRCYLMIQLILNFRKNLCFHLIRNYLMFLHYRKNLLILNYQKCQYFHSIQNFLKNLLIPNYHLIQKNLQFPPVLVHLLRS